VTLCRAVRRRFGLALPGILLPALLLIALLGVNPAVAQDPVASPGASPSPAAAAPSAPPAEVEGYTLSPEKYEDAVNYARARYRLHFLNVAYGLAVLVVLLALGVAPRFRDWAEKLTSRRMGQLVVFAPLLVLTLSLLGLPLEVYGQSLSLKYNQSIQSWGSWAWDWVKGQMIGVIISTILIGVLYAVIRRSQRRWWFYFWLASIPILIFILFISPVLIDPLFFEFTPLETTQADLVAEIEKVVDRGGLSIPRDRMFEMNASSKLKSINAYVTGFGASKRVVVWDNTVQRMTIPQTLFVFGHEGSLRPRSHPEDDCLPGRGAPGLPLPRLPRDERAAGAPGRAVADPRRGRLGLAAGPAAPADGVPVPQRADHQRLQPGAGTRRRHLRDGGDPRHRGQRTERRVRGVPDPR